jgi:DNA-binding transcriptional MerR regulator
MRIGELAEQAGVNVETVRYYERRGLLPEPVRSPGGHREYGNDAVRFVRAVKEAQTLGFTLAEIEEYLALTSRTPSAAATTSRERLEEKLADIDQRLATLQTMRIGVERALYERWSSLDQSTSTAAYLARRGRDPEPGLLHVTNGESAASTLRETSLGGVVLSWNDSLHVGPLAFDPKESRRVRAAFLAECGWGDVTTELARRDELLARADHVVLWFEHDLYDQLQLLQVLAQIEDDAEVELVQADDFLGPLDPPALQALWRTRRKLPPVVRRAARKAWHSVTAGDLRVDVPELAYLAPALRRLAEEREPVSRTKRQLLSLLESGPKSPAELFLANQALEEAPFLGDTWCYRFLWELAEEGLVRPLPLPPPLGDERAFAAARVELA